MSDTSPGTDLAGLIAEVADYPTPGVRFRDITPLIAHPGGLAAAVEQMVAAGPRDVDIVVGLEARGFIFGPAIALAVKEKATNPTDRASIIKMGT